MQLNLVVEKDELLQIQLGARFILTETSELF